MTITKWSKEARSWTEICIYTNITHTPGFESVSGLSVLLVIQVISYKTDVTKYMCIFPVCISTRKATQIFYVPPADVEVKTEIKPWQHTTMTTLSSALAGMQHCMSCYSHVSFCNACLFKFLACARINAFWAWCSGGVRSSRIAATHLGTSGKVAVAGKCIFVPSV